MAEKKTIELVSILTGSSRKMTVNQFRKYRDNKKNDPFGIYKWMFGDV
jgi:hypothetical protein